MTWLDSTSSDTVRRRARLSSREIVLAVMITTAAMVALFAAVDGVLPDKGGNHPVASVHDRD